MCDPCTRSGLGDPEEPRDGHPRRGRRSGYLLQQLMPEGASLVMARSESATVLVKISDLLQYLVGLADA